MTYKQNSDPTSQKTHCISIIMTTRFTKYNEVTTALRRVKS